MTLKELLDKVDFDSLAPFIEKAEGKHLDSIYGYREAYDILRYMKPSENFKGEARVGSRQKTSKARLGSSGAGRNTVMTSG